MSVAAQSKYKCFTAHSVALLVASGIYVNWAPFHQYLKTQGVYAWECTHVINGGAMPNCVERETALACLPVYALSASFSCAVLGGIVRDRFGSKATYALGSILISLSMVLMAINYFNSTNGPPRYDLLPLSFLIWGSSSEMLTISLIGVQQLFPDRKSFILTLIAAMRSLFIFVPEVMRILNPNFMSFTIGYAILSMVWMLYFTNSNYFTRDDFIPGTNRGLLSPSANNPANPTEFIFRREFLSLAMYYMMFITVFNYVVATVPVIYESSPTMRSYVGLVIPLSGVIGSPIIGQFADMAGTLMVPIIESFTCVVILTGLILPNSLIARCAILTAMVFYYSCPAGQVYILVCQAYPSATHGSLCGITFLVGGICGVLSSWIVALMTRVAIPGDQVYLLLHGILSTALLGFLANVYLHFRSKPTPAEAASKTRPLIDASRTDRGFDVSKLEEAHP